MDAILRCRMGDCSSWADPPRTHQRIFREPTSEEVRTPISLSPIGAFTRVFDALTRGRVRVGCRAISPRKHSMADHYRVGRWTGALAVTFAIGACALPTSVRAQAAEDGSAVAYSTNDFGMPFVSVPAGQFPMGCSEDAKPVECSADEKPRHA